MRYPTITQPQSHSTMNHLMTSERPVCVLPSSLTSQIVSRFPQGRPRVHLCKLQRRMTADARESKDGSRRLGVELPPVNITPALRPAPPLPFKHKYRAFMCKAWSMETISCR